MLAIRRRGVLLPLLLLFVACAHAPRAFDETTDVLKFRADYLRANPDGAFDDRIERGEVVRGMSLMEVLASWGVPLVRRADVERQAEYWTFIGRDDASLDWTRFTFVFERGTVTDWLISRHNSKNVRLTDILPPAHFGGWPEDRTDPMTGAAANRK